MANLSALFYMLVIFKQDIIPKYIGDQGYISEKTLITRDKYLRSWSVKNVYEAIWDYSLDVSTKTLMCFFGEIQATTKSQQEYLCDPSMVSQVVGTENSLCFTLSVKLSENKSILGDEHNF